MDGGHPATLRMPKVLSVITRMWSTNIYIYIYICEPESKLLKGGYRRDYLGDYYRGY